MKKQKRKSQYKWPLKRKIIAGLCIFYIVSFCSFLFLFYGPINSFKEFWITSAMTTMNHQYLATWIYSDSYIQKVLENNSIIEVDEISNPDEINFRKYSTTIYRNEYEKEILQRDEENDLYKVINITGPRYNGYLVAIYDPSRIHVAATSKLRVDGEYITDISQRENAIIVMNGGGFYDPDWNSNGALPHGAVIIDGKVVSDYDDARMGGGFIGFTNDNKLVLGRMSTQEALNMGYRDAIEFGPYLIVNGKKSFIRGNGGWGVAPRSAIGQRKDGIVLFLVINGRSATSLGADMVDLTEIMDRYGAYNAANLDGGGSSELVINHQIVNSPCAAGKQGLRKLATFWVVK